MTAALNVDLAILGAGCAGLSLAQRLSENPLWTKKTVLIEARITYTNDRSWCFWEPQDRALRPALHDLIIHRWPKWQFSGQQFQVTHHVPGRDYCYIASDRFYQYALSALKHHHSISLQMGHAVVSVNMQPKGYAIELADGSTLCARQVIDTRPNVYTDSKEATLWQIIYGLEVRASTSVFEPDTVGLMKELNASLMGTQFVYVLPFSSEHALIEWTLFSTQLISPKQMEPLLQAHMHAHYPTTSFQVIRTEHAVLPMGLNINHKKQCSRPNYRYAGQVAGAIRPATGYAFLRIQRWACAAANHMATQQSLPAPQHSPWLIRAMDRLFLEILNTRPKLGPSLFQALSLRVAPAVLVRFLSDEASVLDCARVMRALPAPLFIRHSMQRLCAWSR
jgi:lycopene beta-cyclase